MTRAMTDEAYQASITGKKMCPDCGSRKEINKYNFTWTTKRYRGIRRIYFNKRCRQCYNWLNSEKTVAYGGKQGLRKRLDHCGPVPGTPEHRYFCALLPTMGEI